MHRSKSATSREKILESARRLSREHFNDHEGCCPLLGTAADVERSGEAVKAAYQEVVEQLVKVFEDHLNEPRVHDRALALVALCVGGMGAGEECRRSGPGRRSSC